MVGETSNYLFSFTTKSSILFPKAFATFPTVTNLKLSLPFSNLDIEFTTPEEAVKFLLEQNVIMGFGGFDVDKLSDKEKIDFAKELLSQLKLLSYKYKKQE